MLNIHKVILLAFVSYNLYVGNIFAMIQRTLVNNFAQPHKSEALRTQTKEQFNPAECFDKIWDTINDKFWDPNFNGVDWENTGIRYKPKALAAKDHESFAILINQMPCLCHFC